MYLKTDLNQIIVLYFIIVTHMVKNRPILIYCRTKDQALRESGERKNGPNLNNNHPSKINFKCFYKVTIAFIFERASRGYLIRLNQSPVKEDMIVLRRLRM